MRKILSRSMPYCLNIAYKVMEWQFYNKIQIMFSSYFIHIPTSKPMRGLHIKGINENIRNKKKRSEVVRECCYKIIISQLVTVLATKLETE